MARVPERTRRDVANDADITPIVATMARQACVTPSMTTHAFEAISS
jgi:hypothetical protein